MTDDAEREILDRKAAKRCIWSQDDWDSDAWATSCGHYFTLLEGTPADNDMVYCCHCAKPIEQVLYSEDDA